MHPESKGVATRVRRSVMGSFSKRQKPGGNPWDSTMFVTEFEVDEQVNEKSAKRTDWYCARCPHGFRSSRVFDEP